MLVPLEGNPGKYASVQIDRIEVLNAYLNDLGVKGLEFYDVYSVDDLGLLAFIPRPIYALLLIFPSTSKNYQEYREKEDAIYKQPEGQVVWFKQTVRNACGTMGILHATANLEPDLIGEGMLKRVLDELLPLEPLERAKKLESSELFKVHESLANRGDTMAPSDGEEVDLHYVCMTKRGNVLYELDGSRKGPIARGELGPDDDLLSEKALDSVRAFIDRERESGLMEFSLLALGPSS